jgi:hypothetical protein
VAFLSGRSEPDPNLSIGLRWCPAGGIGRWVVAGVLVAVGRLVAGKSSRTGAEAPQLETCAHTDPLGNRCESDPTHNVTWPKHALWSADYCEIHVNEVRRVPGVTVTCLDGEEE